MHDLTFERETSFPKLHHFVEVLEPVTPSECFALVFVEIESFDPDVVTFADLDLLDLYAFDAHEETRAFRAKSGV
jgi:hypothetical protein